MAYRIFNGKRYYETELRYSKADAAKSAKAIRAKGGNARITVSGKPPNRIYTIWARG